MVRHKLLSTRMKWPRVNPAERGPNHHHYTIFIILYSHNAFWSYHFHRIMTYLAVDSIQEKSRRIEPGNLHPLIHWYTLACPVKILSAMNILTGLRWCTPICNEGSMSVRRYSFLRLSAICITVAHNWRQSFHIILISISLSHPMIVCG